MMNSVYFGAGKGIEVLLDARPLMAVEHQVPLAEKNLVVVACGFEPVATLDEFSSCLRFITRFAPAAQELTPAAQ